MLAGGDHRSRDWSAVPGELLERIRGRLPAPDFARFAAVCTAWRRAAFSTPAPQPWLMVPPSPSSSSSSPGQAATCRFFSPSDRKTYLVSVPELAGTRCVGSCEGWVASFDATAELSLVNPLTRARIPLPSPLLSMPTFTIVRGADGRIVEYTRLADPLGLSMVYRIHETRGLIDRVFMSSKPTDPACKVTASFRCFLPPASIAVGGEKWTALEGLKKLVDIVYHDGDGKCYALNSDNRVFRWCADDVKTLELYCPPAPDFPPHLSRIDRRLAVHRPSGDLLMVFFNLRSLPRVRYVLHSTVRNTGAVNAFRYRSGAGSAGTWLRLKSLGGCSLFLGRNQSICLSAQDAPELRADCIFLIGQIHECDDRERHWTHDFWVYDLKEESLEPFCLPDWQNNCGVPLWFTPNLS